MQRTIYHHLLFDRGMNQSVGGEPAGTTNSDDFELEAQEIAGGRSSSVVGGGVRGIVAILDEGQEMDRCSCDLVKVSLVLHRHADGYDGWSEKPPPPFPV